MRIAMIGTGYVGLVSGACFAEFGAETTCIDMDQTKIARLKRGEIPIYEPGLDGLVAVNTEAGRLHFTTSMDQAVASADAVFIAVGTPSRPSDGHADLSYVFAAAEQIAQHLTGYTVIVTKSTVPVGTGAKVAEIIRRLRPDADFDVCSNPEFLREGSAIDDFMRPDRVVIGADTERARDLMRELYRPLYLIDTPIIMTTLTTAELTKYAANSFLAVKLTFINEIADLCERVGGDVYDVARGVGLDSRIGRKFFNPGPGYGGSCFPKDTLALVQTAQQAGAPMRIIETVVDVNKKRKQAMAGRIIEACGGSINGCTVAVLGVTFKPNTDDMRDAPSLDIVPALQAAGATVRAYDPAGMEEAAKLMTGIEWCADAYDATLGASVAVVITEWNEFRGLDLQRLKAVMTQPVMVDFRNLYSPAEMAGAGFLYRSIGRPEVAAVEPSPTVETLLT